MKFEDDGETERYMEYICSIEHSTRIAKWMLLSISISTMVIAFMLIFFILAF